MSVIDKYEKIVMVITGSIVALFIFSILYAKDKYKSNAPKCIK
jgi:cytochrome c oxidase subunit 2